MKKRKNINDKNINEAIYKLWTEYIHSPVWVPLDRWLGKNIRELKGFKQEKKLRIGHQIREACRFGVTILFFEYINYRINLKKAGSHLPKNMMEKNLEDFLLGISRPENLKKRLMEIRPENLFHWLSVLQSDGEQASNALKNYLQLETNKELIYLRCGIIPAAVPFIKKRVALSQWNLAQESTFIKNHLRPAPLWLRLNHPTKKNETIKGLTGEGFFLEFFAPDMLKVKGKSGIYTSTHYQNGDFEIQDKGSQQIGNSLEIRPGQFIWDCCAGIGGKTLQIASKLDGKGTVIATEISSAKIETLRLRARRARLSDIVITKKWDGKVVPEFGRAIEKRKGFDAVLVDAPCSGSGTWRHNPDGKLFFNPNRISELNKTQIELLSTVASSVRPGGLLIYATCSFFVEENEEVVNKFLASTPEFKLISMNLFGSPKEDADTTFSAVMQRE